MDDINESRYEDTEVNETKVNINDTKIVDNTPQPQKRPTRESSGKELFAYSLRLQENCTIV